MEELVYSNDKGVFTNSSKVAKKFGKQHKNVLASIQNVLEQIPEGNDQLIFKPVTYIDSKGEVRPEYEMNRDAFSLLVMGFTGEKAMKFKIEFINAFNKMEEKLSQNHAAPMSMEEMMIFQLQEKIKDRKRLEALEENNKEIQQEIKLIKAHQTTSPNNYFTVAGFASLKNIYIDLGTAKKIGMESSKHCKELGYVMGSVPDARYGTVKTYPVDVLDSIFKQNNFTSRT